MRIEIGHGQWKTVVETKEKTLAQFEYRLRDNYGFLDEKYKVFIPYHAIDYLKVEE